MIEVTVKRNRQGIEEITLSGHADAGPHGSDIVCSAVSAVSFGTLNAVHALLGVIPDVEQAADEGGFLRWRITPVTDGALHEKLQLLAESMVVALVSVSERYGAYITVRDAKWQGGA